MKLGYKYLYVLLLTIILCSCNSSKEDDVTKESETSFDLVNIAPPEEVMVEVEEKVKENKNLEDFNWLEALGQVESTNNAIAIAYDGVTYYTDFANQTLNRIDKDGNIEIVRRNLFTQLIKESDDLYAIMTEVDSGEANQANVIINLKEGFDKTQRSINGDSRKLRYSGDSIYYIKGKFELYREPVGAYEEGILEFDNEIVDYWVGDNRIFLTFKKELRDYGVASFNQVNGEVKVINIQKPQAGVVFDDYFLYSTNQQGLYLYDYEGEVEHCLSDAEIGEFVAYKGHLLYCDLSEGNTGLVLVDKEGNILNKINSDIGNYLTVINDYIFYCVDGKTKIIQLDENYDEIEIEQEVKYVTDQEEYDAYMEIVKSSNVLINTCVEVFGDEISLWFGSRKSNYTKGAHRLSNVETSLIKKLKARKGIFYTKDSGEVVVLPLKGWMEFDTSYQSYGFYVAVAKARKTPTMPCLKRTYLYDFNKMTLEEFCGSVYFSPDGNKILVFGSDSYGYSKEAYDVKIYHYNEDSFELISTFSFEDYGIDKVQWADDSQSVSFENRLVKQDTWTNVDKPYESYDRTMTFLNGEYQLSDCDIRNTDIVVSYTALDLASEAEMPIHMERVSKIEFLDTYEIIDGKLHLWFKVLVDGNEFFVHRELKEGEKPLYFDMGDPDYSQIISFITDKGLISEEFSGEHCDNRVENYLAEIGYYCYYYLEGTCCGYLINKHTGEEYTIEGYPILSPDKKKMVVFGGFLHEDKRICVYEINDGIKLVYDNDEEDWSVGDVEWYDDSTITFIKKNYSTSKSNKAILTYIDGKWIVEDVE